MAETDKVILYQVPGRAFGMPNLSPFCIKLECYLRMTGIPYELQAGNPVKAPRGKIPYVLIDGEILSDSQLILDKLAKTPKGAALDAGLSEEQRAQGHLIRRMLEEAYYFVGLYLRWGDDRGFAILAPEFKKVMGGLSFLLPLVRRRVKRNLYAQGALRHRHEDLMAMGKEDMHALSVFLGSRPYLLGDRPTSYDATVYGFLEGLFGFPYESEIKVYAQTLSNLVGYRQRMRTQYFTELG